MVISDLFNLHAKPVVSVEIFPDDFLWLPHIFYAKTNSPEEAVYYGYKWACLIYLWGIEIRILKPETVRQMSLW